MYACEKILCFQDRFFMIMVDGWDGHEGEGALGTFVWLDVLHCMLLHVCSHLPMWMS